MTLSPADYAVLLAYIVGMIALGVALSRQQKSGEDYFLAGRSMPWLAVGVSVIASLLSSLTYLSEPGEVWKSGITHMFGKMLAIPFEMALVWMVCIPLMMRFQYTSAYEYLDDRFGGAARRVGVALFLLMVMLWMGFVVLATAKALATLSGMRLEVVIAVIGLVATIYTTLGGLRAVVWTDVIQVALLVGGGMFGIIYVAAQTQSGPVEWLETVRLHLEAQNHEAMPIFSWDPTVRATVVTVAINMFIWHVCTHVGNQMTVQRYFSTSSTESARRSFVTGSLFGVGLNLMLMFVGLAMLHYYVGGDRALPASLDAGRDQSLIFPAFAVHELPAGLGGGILAALLAAAMSSIDSGVNSIATVVSVERDKGSGGRKRRSESEVIHDARVITVVTGIGIALAAYLLSYMPSDWGIVDAMPRTFNACTAPMGGMFLAGMFIPRATQRSVVAGAFFGFLASILIGYSQELATMLEQAGMLPTRWSWLASTRLSFTWVMPCSLATTLIVSALLGSSPTIEQKAE